MAASAAARSSAPNRPITLHITGAWPSRPQRTLRSTDARSTSWNSWNTAAWRRRKARLRAALETVRAPSTVTEPSLGATRPWTARSRVVLPDPLGPITASRSPAATESASMESAGSSPGA